MGFFVWMTQKAVEDGVSEAIQPLRHGSESLTLLLVFHQQLREKLALQL